MAGLSLKNVCKIYADGVEAVKDFNLEVEDGEFIIIVGPSGCGKSTTLRMIAGLDDITSGELYIGGELMNDVEPKDRDIAMVFQNYALYPHMTVYNNMAFGLKRRHVPRDEVRRRVTEAAKGLGIDDLLNRKPKALSGGQRQRVAMGRAIVRDPKVFLMDEPLSNLDAKLRSQMRVEISNLHRRLGTTFVYVTHDQTEAMTLGTRIVVMDKGVVQQVDSPQALYDKPCNMYVAGFIGSPQMNFIHCRLVVDEGGVAVVAGDKKAQLPAEKAAVLAQVAADGREVVLGARPETMGMADVSSPVPTGMLRLESTVSAYEMLGAEALLYFGLGEAQLCAKVPSHSAARVGDVVNIDVDLARAHVFDAQTTQALAH